MRKTTERGAARTGPRKNLWNLSWAIPRMLAYLTLYLVPVWGPAAISASRFQTFRQDPEQSIPLAGLFFIGALLLLIVSTVHWFVTGRRPSGFYEIQSWLAVVLGGLTAAAVQLNGVEHGVESWSTWIVPVLISVAYGVVFLIALLVARLSRNARSSTPARSGRVVDTESDPSGTASA